MNKAECNNLRAKAGRASSLEEVGALLARVEAAIQDGDLAYQDSGSVLLSIYTAAQRLSEDQPEAGWKFLFDSLLPLYLRAGRAKTLEKRMELHECRELAEEWLNAYRGDDERGLLERALSYFAAHLDPRNRAVFERACWAVQSIGYREDGTLAKLHALLAELPGVQGDEVLRAIVDMGVPAAEQPALRRELHRRVRRRLNYPLIHSLRALADESTFELVFGAKPPRPVATAKAGDLYTLMSVLSHIAERMGAGPLCDRVVQAIERLYRQHPDAVGSSVYLGGYLLPHCDSPEAVRFIATLVAQKEATESKTTHALWLLNHRLRACVRPAQQAGMDGALGSEALAALQVEALRPGVHVEGGATFEGEAKRCAVDTALTFGAKEALSWFEPVLDTEKNILVLHELMETYAAFRFMPLPTKIKEWVTEQKDARDPDPHAEWMVRTAATMVARSTCSEEAFEVLLHPGFTMEGDVMRSTVDGLADVALMRSESSANSAVPIVTRLLAALAAEPIPPQASAVCHSLLLQAMAGHLPEALWETLADHAKNERLKTYPRSQLVAALAFFPAVRHSQETLRWLGQIAADYDDWLGWRALETLVQLGVVADMPGDLSKKFGLKKTGAGWVWRKDEPQLQWSTGMVAQLYKQQPRRFALAVETILREGDFAQAAQLLPDLETPPGPAVVQALVDRIKKSNTPRTIEFGLFLYLGRLAPDRLVGDDWPASWTNWLPESRVDLADAVCRCWPQGGFSAETGLRLLVPLLGDGHYGVRRSAARALGRIVPEVLLDFCGGLAQSDQVADRMRAAELSVWTPATDRSSAWNLLRESLFSDRHKVVRESARRAEQADQRRAWGMTHLQKTLLLRDSDNAAVLACWRYGRALTHTGDDEALWLLTEHLEKEKLPLNVRYLQIKVAKELEKLWGDVIKKRWPNPVAPSRGSTEAGEGIYISSSGRNYPVLYTVWRLAATIEHAGTRWGGSAQPKGGGRFEEDLLTKEGTLLWEDGRRAKMHVTAIYNSAALLFSGSGAYPLPGKGSAERSYAI